MTKTNSNKNKPRKVYTDEQKAAAVKRVNGGDTITAVAKDLGCSMASVSKWVEKAAELPSVEVKPEDLHAEVIQLRAQIRSLTDERNALAYTVYAAKGQ